MHQHIPNFNQDAHGIKYLTYISVQSSRHYGCMFREYAHIKTFGSWSHHNTHQSQHSSRRFPHFQHSFFLLFRSNDGDGCWFCRCFREIDLLHIDESLCLRNIIHLRRYFLFQSFSISLSSVVGAACKGGFDGLVVSSMIVGTSDGADLGGSGWVKSDGDF